MTISIPQQQRFHWILGFMGLAVVLAVAVVAVMQTTTTDGSGASSVDGNDRISVARQQARLQSIQDDYLTPPAILAEQAAATAFLELQDAFLPPAEPGPADSGDESAIQDGYLPPEVWTAETQAPRPDAVNLGSRAPQ